MDPITAAGISAYLDSVEVANIPPRYAKGIIGSAPFPRFGWEMDNVFWLTRSEVGGLILWAANHGQAHRMTLEDLDTVIEESRQTLNRLKKLRAQLTEED